MCTTGFGLFNLVFSLSPKKVQSLVGFLGFKHDHALALWALAGNEYSACVAVPSQVSAGVEADGARGAGGRDVHGVFAGREGIFSVVAGWACAETGCLGMGGRGCGLLKRITDTRVFFSKIEARYPTGALWILNRARILRMSGDAQGAIAVLQCGLEAPQTFVQADTLLVFEPAWTLPGKRLHQEAADAFVRLMKLNSCGMLRVARQPRQGAGAVPNLLSRKKMGGKDLPTEVLIRKMVEFYKEKQKHRGGDPARYPELAICGSSFPWVSPLTATFGLNSVSTGYTCAMLSMSEKHTSMQRYLKGLEEHGVLHEKKVDGTKHWALWYAGDIAESQVVSYALDL
ncbi:hypothetical protein C8R44DRAFT_747967 [Mycena epipterygia]|nr:hypothetical protein C8R44DRAFT_747967 [Mycena epipterygia]